MNKILSFFKPPSAGADPKPFYAMLAAGMVLVAVSFTLASGGKEVEALENRHAELSGKLAELDVSIAEKQSAQDSQKKEAVIEASGLDPSLINIDTDAATEYFGAAFNWSNGSEYDLARAKYDESLGKGNTFTKTYFPENTKIPTADGEVNFIDFKEMRAQMEGMVIVPLTAEGERVRYVAFVRYYMFKDAEDVNNTDALTPSDAIIEFTASGDPDGERTVSEVEAWAGFSAVLE